MPPLLYLDTARLGQMTPAAKDAQLDFVRLSAEEPSSLYFEEFLRDGFAAWPNSYQQCFPGLCTWHGVAGLKRSIRQLIHAPDDWRVLLASRSLSLIKLAASCMFRQCQSVLATDLNWPTYQQAVEAEARRTGKCIMTIPLRNEILHGGWTAMDVARRIACAFQENRCDGLFLPAVDHLGIRLSIRMIVEQIRRRGKLRFVLIDAAQALGHVPLDDCLKVGDFIVAGSQKWIGAYLPMGIGLLGPRRSGELIENLSSRSDLKDVAQDPLLHFTEQLDTKNLDGHSETANLSPLFACAGAVRDHNAIRPSELTRDFKLGDQQLSRLCFPIGEWKPVRPLTEFRSRIELLQLANNAGRDFQPGDLRRAWLNAGAIVTAISGNLVRLSFPHANGARTSGTRIHEPSEC